MILQTHTLLMFPLFCHIYLYQGSATGSLGLQPAENVANPRDFKVFEAFGLLRSGYFELLVIQKDFLCLGVFFEHFLNHIP